MGEREHPHAVPWTQGLPARVEEESLLLPAINLTDTPDELESTSVLVLVPVPRAQLPRLKAMNPGRGPPIKSAHVTATIFDSGGK